MTGRLAGRTAIVTGASRGLGRSIALALAAEGAAVAVVARTEQVWNDKLPGTIGETVAEIEAAGGRAVAIRADLTNRDDLPRLVDEARDALGPITHPGQQRCVHRARPAADTRSADAAEEGTGCQSPNRRRRTGRRSSEHPVHAFRRHFEIAVFAAYELMQLVVPDMINAGGGAIVNISSIASRIPGMGPYRDFSGGVLPGYGGSKAALEHLTSSAAYELARRNIAVNALSPSEAMMTPGLSYYRMDFDEVGSEADFAEAVVRLALVDPR